MQVFCVHIQPILSIYIQKVFFLVSGQKEHIFRLLPVGKYVFFRHWRRKIVYTTFVYKKNAPKNSLNVIWAILYFSGYGLVMLSAIRKHSFLEKTMFSHWQRKIVASLDFRGIRPYSSLSICCAWILLELLENSSKTYVSL